MLTVHFLSKMFFLGSVYFASWGKSCAGAILSLNTIGWSGHVWWCAKRQGVRLGFSLADKKLLTACQHRNHDGTCLSDWAVTDVTVN